MVSALQVTSLCAPISSSLSPAYSSSEDSLQKRKGKKQKHVTSHEIEFPKWLSHPEQSSYFIKLKLQVHSSSEETTLITLTEMTPRQHPGWKPKMETVVSRQMCLWTYFAVSTTASSREAELSLTAQDDSRRPPALEASLTTASDMAVGSHTVTEKRGVTGHVSHWTTDKHISKHLQKDKHAHSKKSPQGLNEEFFLMISKSHLSSSS